MEFLKKNWSKLIIVVFSFIAAVLVLVPVFMASKIEVYAACQTIGIIIFFVGLAIRMCLKMSDTAKDYSKHILICAGALTLALMSIGAAGFCTDKDKAQGALGNAFAIFKNVPYDIKAGEEKLEAGKEQRDGLVTMNAGLTTAGTGVIAQLTAAAGALSNPDLSPKVVLSKNLVATMTPLINGNAELNADQKTAAIAQITQLQGGLAAAGLGDLTVEYASVALNTMIGMANTQITEGQAQIDAMDIDATKKDAAAGATMLISLYIAMMIAFGGMPLLKGIYKLVNKDE